MKLFDGDTARRQLPAHLFEKDILHVLFCCLSLTYVRSNVGWKFEHWYELAATNLSLTLLSSLCEFSVASQ